MPVLAVTFGLAIAVLAAACEDRPDYLEVEERVDAVNDALGREVDAFREDVQRRLEYVDRDLDRLRAEAADAAAGIRQGMQREIESFEERKEVLEERLEELRGESRAAWDSLRTELAREIAELEREIRHLRTDLAGSKKEAPVPPLLRRA